MNYTIKTFIKHIEDWESYFIEKKDSDSEYDYEPDLNNNDDYDDDFRPIRNRHYNGALDMDQQSVEFWDDL